MITDVNSEQYSNVLVLMCVTFSGISTAVNPDLEKAELPMTSICGGKSIEFRLLQPANAPAHIFLILFGIVTVVKPEILFMGNVNLFVNSVRL